MKSESGFSLAMAGQPFPIKESVYISNAMQCTNFVVTLLILEDLTTPRQVSTGSLERIARLESPKSLYFE